MTQTPAPRPIPTPALRLREPSRRKRPLLPAVGGRALLLAGWLLAPAGAGAQQLDVPYVSTPAEVVEAMLELAGVGPGDYVIDLGCGDGRIVIAAARRGAVGHGVDIDPQRIREAEANAREAGVADRVIFMEENIFETDFSRATVVTMYLLTSVNLRLRDDLLGKLAPGTRLVSHSFGMDDWEPDETVRVNNRFLYFWIIPARAAGQWRWTTGGQPFTLTVRQRYQQIELVLESEQGTLQVEQAALRGDRITFTAYNSATGARYVYSGRIDGSRIIGTVQVRRANIRRVEPWSATDHPPVGKPVAVKPFEPEGA